jgi:hypothetical protein
MLQMGSTALLIWGLLFSSIGLGYFLYGKNQQVLAPLLSGLALMIFPYFVSSVTALVLIGLVLCVIPYYFRRRY